MTRSVLRALGVGLAVLSASYSVDMHVTRTLAGARLRLTVDNAATHRRVRRFDAVHAAPMHVFVAGGPGLTVFRHERPRQEPDGSFTADLPLPAAGPYMAFAEYLPSGGTPQLFQQAFGLGEMVVRPRGDVADEPHAAGGVRATLDAPHVTRGDRSTLSFALTDESSGSGVADLEPFDEAPAQVFAVSADLTESVHAYADGDGRGPSVTVSALFPRAGRYKLWLEVRRAGETAALPFVIDVH
jgi:hypothetical protein